MLKINKKLLQKNKFMIQYKKICLIKEKRKMFAYIKGSLEMKLNDSVVIEANGVGYKIYMAQNAIDKVRKYWRHC